MKRSFLFSPKPLTGDLPVIQRNFSTCRRTLLHRVHRSMENFTVTSMSGGDDETEPMKSKEGHVAVINPFASSREPLPYDPMLGWYTAATLSGLLILFLACVGLEKVKDKILMTFEKDQLQGTVRRGDRASLAGGCDAGLTRGSTDDPKCLAENDALLGRNCVDHNYVYLTLDRPNHVDATQSSPSAQVAAGSPMPRLPAGCPPPTMNSRSPTGGGLAGDGAEPVPSSTACETGEGGTGDETRTTKSSFGAVQTHNVKIEIVEVHSESPVHDVVIREDRDVHESVV